MPQYYVYKQGSNKFRNGVRDGYYVTDIVLTATGFSGIENTDWKCIDKVLIPAGPNGAPSNLMLTSIKSTEATLYVSTTSDNHSGFKFYKSSDGGTTYTLAGTSATPSFTATGLTAGTLYQFYATVYKGTESDPTNIASCYTLPAPVLDTYGSAAVAYSLRKLRTAYAGNCVNIRRESDNATLDIGFVDGVVDESSMITFCGQGNGYVVTWYDQSGNGVNLTQAATARQPLIVIKGLILKSKGIPYIKFNGSSYALFADNVALFKNIGYISATVSLRWKAVPTSNTAIFFVSRTLDSGSRFFMNGGIVSGKYTVGGRRSDADTYQGAESISNVTTETTIVTNIIDYTNSDAYIRINGSVDKTENSFLTAGLTSNTNSLHISLGAAGTRAAPGTFAYADIFECIAYNTDQAANLAGIESNANIYLSKNILLPQRMPYTKNQHILEECGGYLYAAGGDSYYDVNSPKKLFRYDPVNKVWATMADMPFAQTEQQSAIMKAVGGKLYFIGGQEAGIAGLLNTVYCYDPSDNTWSSKTAMTTAREDFGAAVVGTKIYCFGGLAGAYVPSKILEVYDTVNDSWESKADMPAAKCLGDFGAACNGKIYAIASVNDFTGYPTDLKVIDTVFKYDPVANTWSTVTEIPEGTAYKSCVTIGNKIYVAGGMKAGDGGTRPLTNLSNKIYIYDTISNTWSLSKVLLPYGTASLGLATLNNKIYGCGGFFASEMSDQLWEFTVEL